MNTKQLTGIFYICLFSLGLVSTAHSALILQINTSNQTWALVGSDTGTMELVNGFGFATWEIHNIGGFGTGVSQLRNDATWSSTVGTPGAVGFSQTDTELSSSAVVSGTIQLAFSNESNLSQTITGLGNFQSYAIPADAPVRVDFDAGAIARFESAIGSTLILDRGTGFSNINIVAAPATVPIPAAAWLFGSGLLGLVGIARRKKA